MVFKFFKKKGQLFPSKKDNLEILFAFNFPASKPVVLNYYISGR